MEIDDVSYDSPTPYVYPEYIAPERVVDEPQQASSTESPAMAYNSYDYEYMGQNIDYFA